MRYMLARADSALVTGVLCWEGRLVVFAVRVFHAAGCLCCAWLCACRHC